MSGPSRGSVWGDPPGQPPLQEPAECTPVRSISRIRDFLRLWKGAFSRATRTCPETNAELTKCSPDPWLLSSIATPGLWRIRSVTPRILNMILSAIRGKIVTQIGLAGRGQDHQPQPRLHSHPPLKRTSIEVPASSVPIWSTIIFLSSYRNRPANEALLPCGSRRRKLATRLTWSRVCQN